MNRRGQVLSVVAVAGLAHSAFAADINVRPNPPPPVASVNWTGFYLGGDIGAVFASARYNRPNSGLSDTSIGTLDQRPAYGLYGGFNYQVLPWAVIGVEGSYTWLSDATYRELGPQFDFLQESRHIDSVTARAGVLLRPDTLIYGKLGPAWIQVQGFKGFGTPFQQTLNSIQSGIGIETLLTPNWILRAEASYTYADQLLSLNQGFDLYRPGILLLQAGVAYKFDAPAGWGTPAAAPAPQPAMADGLPKIFYKAPKMVTKAPAAAVAQAPAWTGLEAGGFISANGNQVRYNDTLAGELGPFTDFVFGGGWFVGANYQFQRLVIGVDASGNYESANFNNAAGSGGLLGNFYNFAKIDRVLAVTGRAGWLATPGTLLYVKAGPAWMRMSTDPAFWNSIAPNATGASTYSGYEAGLGAEAFVLPNVSVRLEGLYVHSGDKVILNGTVPNEFTLQPSIISTTVGVAVHI